MKAAGFSSTVKILLEHGADTNAKDEQGKLHAIIFTISIHPSIYLYSFIYQIIYYRSNMSIYRKNQSYDRSKEWLHKNG